MSRRGLKRNGFCARMAEMLTHRIEKEVAAALENLGLHTERVLVEESKMESQGDYTTNVALLLAKKENKNPTELAGDLAEILGKNSTLFSKVEVAGPGFINFFLVPEVFRNELGVINEQYGKTGVLVGQKVIVEHTDPNPFKAIHIGHLMTNTIGECLSRLVKWQEAETKQACYQGDVGLHVAKALWSYLKSEHKNEDDLVNGNHYAWGSAAYAQNKEVEVEIKSLNKKIYEKSDPLVTEAYESGKRASLAYFEKIYKKLGTHFDFYFFESETGAFGKKVVMEGVDQGIFEKSDGAIIFRGEAEGLHNRVFVNSEGLPTYEAKELGLAKIKFDAYPYDLSVVVTGNEVNDYFKVVMRAMEKVFPELAQKTVHLSHGMLRLPSGKMSSRTGDVITAEHLLKEVGGFVRTKIEASDRQIEDKEKLTEEVAVAAVKYSILRQAIGRDIIFDFEKSISFEGDSGPYLQYAYARACSVLRKARTEGVAADLGKAPEDVLPLEKKLALFPETVTRAASLYAPNYVVTYLTELASTFNAHYATHVIVDATHADSPYQVALTEKFATVMKNGLWLLGIQAPEKM